MHIQGMRRRRGVKRGRCNFESGRDAEVDARGKIIFGAVYRHTPGKDFLPSSEICARTIYNFESGFRFDKEPM